MKKLISNFLFTLAIFSMPAIAGSGHDHGQSHNPITQQQVVDLASQKVQHLVDAGKVDATWVGARSSSAAQKTFAHGPEWVVTFKNDNISDSTKQILYLFYSLGGQYIAANFTGN